MGIKIRVSPTIVLSIANAYQSASRVFMEYIDNSIDSAEQFFDDSTNSYSKKIHIVVNIDPERKTVTFVDNCKGMNKEELIDIAQRIGDSKKRGDFATSGQFGFGIHAYAACARKITVTSLVIDAKMASGIEIDREQAYKEDGEISNIEEVSSGQLPIDSGTIVILSDFDKSWWKGISLDSIRNEIENHFEQLLKRDRLELRIIFGKDQYICKPFDYQSHAGIEIEKEIDRSEIEDGKTGYLYSTQFPSTIKIYLKITENIIPNKRPIFVRRGRRIEEVQAIKSFRNFSKRKGQVWNHGNLTGYIEVGQSLEPTLHRDDFTRGTSRNAIYNEMDKIESEIAQHLQTINQRSQDASMNQLAGQLSNILSHLAREDNMKYKTHISKGTDINLEQLENAGFTVKREGQKERQRNSSGSGGVLSPALEKIFADETLNNSDLKGKETKRSGLNIEFSDQAPPKTTNGDLLRSNYIDDVGVIIYTSHHDFKQRARKVKQGDIRVTERLVSYLATEIAVHYKDKFFSAKAKQPEVQEMMTQRKNLFNNIAEFIYSFEQKAQFLVDKDLSSLDAINK